MSEKKNNSWPMTRDQSFIAAAVFVSFFVLWFLWAAVGNKFICWIGGKSNLSGWVQAFGSIVAIIGAALFPIIHYRYMENKKNLDQLKLDKQLMLRVKKVFIDLEKDINSCSVRYIFCLKKSEDYSDEYGFILDELPIKEINKLFEEFLLWFKPYHNLMGDPLISSSVSGVSGDISRLMSLSLGDLKALEIDVMRYRSSFAKDSAERKCRSLEKWRSELLNISFMLKKVNRLIEEKTSA